MVFVVGFAWLWVIGPLGEASSTSCVLELPEGSSSRVGAQIWPPGTQECVATLPDGSVRRSTFFPWRSWLALGLVALGAGVAVADRRSAGRLLAGALVLLALAVLLAISGSAGAWSA